MTEQVFFRTTRLVVRRFDLADHDPLTAIAGDPQVVHFVGDGAPLSPETCMIRMKRSHSNVARFGYGTGGIVDKLGQFVG